MKKNVLKKSLKLNRETLHLLEEPQLQDAGGAGLTGYSGQPSPIRCFNKDTCNC
ncbi:MAG TPA: class I lanthipeptide [Thermoanaerobaculia bacterium]|nr:class I lanthipeptide [Thermoanaerobaculia bacterium]